ncbi:alpha/beta hydrolase [Streptomyces sp. NPDC004111]|uniref:alpha/beta hydrolase n=1 Tax=Streptomyces sp. NPDC004111 TaxID=3364690 RepID=UPI0036B48225
MSGLLGGRPVRWVRPPDGALRGTHLHFHGGGYRVGTPELDVPLASHLARRLRVQVALPAYRLAPAHPFPAAVEDGLAAYGALLAGGTPAERITVGGDSAGGGLAFAVLLAAQEAGLPAPAAAIGLSPWLDLTLTAASFERCAATDPLLGRDSLGDSAAVYLAGADPRTPTASPLFAEDKALAALPPALLQASRDEVLCDDAVRFAERVKAAGGACRVELWPGTTHCWQLSVATSAEAVRAADSVAEFLTQHFD